MSQHYCREQGQARAVPLDCFLKMCALARNYSTFFLEAKCIAMVSSNLFNVPKLESKGSQGIVTSV